MLVRGLLSTLLYTPRRLNITAAVMLTPLVADVSLVIHLSIWRVIAAVPLASPVYFKGGCSLCCFSDLSPGLVFRQRLVSRPGILFFLSLIIGAVIVRVVYTTSVT